MFDIYGIPTGVSGFDPTDITNTDPGLGSLNQTLPLLPGSPAIDHGGSSFAVTGYSHALSTLAYNEQRAKILEAKAKGQDYKPEKEVPEPYRFWTQMMDDHCEYWDPPAPEEKGKMSMVGMKMKGRFGPHYRNDLNPYIGETYFTDWVTGNSITDYIFFDQAEGSVAGPFKGPQGYYITRVLRHIPPTRSLNLGEARHLDLLRQDWLRVQFMKYSRDAVAQADVKGFAKG
jgi:hypothetical protein